MEPYSPWLHGHFRFQLMYAFGHGKLTDADLEGAMPGVLEVLRENACATTSNYDIEPVLHRLFGASDGLRREPPTTLDDRQRRVLQALHDNESLWEARSGNLSMVMESIGLANDRNLVGRVLGH